MSNILGIDRYRVDMRCATKARPRVVKRGNKVHTHMPDSYTNWMDEFVTVFKSANTPVMRTDPLTMTITVYFKGKARGDADNYAGAIMDACQGMLYENDKQVKELHIELLEDTKQQVIEMTLSKYTPEAE